jgi:hypothetical protein
VIDLAVVHHRRTRLGQNARRLLSLNVLPIAIDSQLGPKADIKNGLHAQGFEPTVKIEKKIWKG